MLYVKEIFNFIRQELDLKGKNSKNKKLPNILTEDELIRFYEAVWNDSNRIHMIMIKVLLYTGIRNFELTNIKIEDMDLKSLKCRIDNGKGKKDRYVPLPLFFRGELNQYISIQKEKGSIYLFETNRKNKFTTRWIREIVKRYAIKAGINKKIHPHLFRHQLLTFLTQKGIIDSKVQLISGHKNRESLSIYQELSLGDVEEEYREAMKEFPVK
ncbi:MAG: tyrosine-type recombinase/integrase [Desulfobacterales bacterium]|nr:tyrosine-type recombinase/integrase [Desulfobacterales bacterium]